MNILIVGYPFIRKTHRDTFDFYPEKNSICFLVPKVWKTKGGKAVFFAPRDENIFSGRSFFSHSHYPLVGGLLKGLILSFPFILWRAKTTKQIQLVHVCSELTLLTTAYYALCAKILGLRFTLYSWENIDYTTKFSGLNLFFKKLVLKVNLGLSSGLLCGNRKCEVIHRQYMKSKPTAVFPMNGSDTELFKPQPGTKNFKGIDYNGKIVFIFVGAIEKRKGINHILNVFPEVLRQVTNAHLIIAGAGQDDALLNQQINRLNMPDHITRISWVNHEELVQLLNASDVFVYPSLSYKGWEEQFGYSMAEASLVEIPVIATKTGSIEEVVIDKKTGILVEQNSVGQLKEAMIYLGLDSQLRHQMGQAGRRHITSNFSNPVIAKKYFDFFSKIIRH